MWINRPYPKVDMALLKRLGVSDFLDARSFWAQIERVLVAACSLLTIIVLAGDGHRSASQAVHSNPTPIPAAVMPKRVG